MASIRKRGENSYEITVSCGYRNGKKITKYKSVKLEDGLSEKQINKQLDDLARDFEKEVQNGTYLDAAKVTFEEFTAKWLTDHAEIKLRPKTVSRYWELLKRILPTIGHIKLEKLQPTMLIEFYKNLAENGMRIDYTYALIPEKSALLSDIKSLSLSSSLNERTIKGLLKGKRASAKFVEKICKALNVPVKSLFTIIDGDKGLSDKTISEHHKLISSILTRAVYWQVIVSNPAERVEPPKVEPTEAKWFRLGELSVLEWSDIDFEKKLIKISKQLQYLPGQGIYELDCAKSVSGKRSIPIPDTIIFLLQRYKKWQTEERLKQGDKWIDHDKLFTKENGEPIFPETPSQWFRKFRVRNGLPDLAFHGIRHTNASVMISQGVDIATVSKRLGHYDINITQRTYIHAIEENNREGTDAIDNAINRNKRGRKDEYNSNA